MDWFLYDNGLRHERVNEDNQCDEMITAKANNNKIIIKANNNKITIKANNNKMEQEWLLASVYY